MTGDTIISAMGITKSFGAQPVLAGVDLHVQRGEIVALLGPNGAGKTTLVNILTTLVRPDAGHATINGFDLGTQPAQVRSSISLTGQSVAVDGFLTGRENLTMLGRLAHLGTTAARRRAAELLGQFELDAAADRRAATYSGGMRRRLDLAMSLVARPPVIFLDEPTTGLDPRSRQALWGAVRELAGAGTAILLTTQYLEEADHLADRIAVVDAGAIIAEGTADDLKRSVSGERVELTFPDAATFGRACAVLGEGVASAVGAPKESGRAIHHDRERMAVSVGGDDAVLLTRAVLDLMAEHRLAVDAIAIVRPSLDDVFLALTGHGSTEVAA